MDKIFSERAVALADRYAREKVQWEKRQAGTPQSEARRVLQKILSELSGFSSKISDAVGEFNDLGSMAGLRIELWTDPAPHYAVAVYRLTLTSIFNAQFELVIAVDPDGRMTGFLSFGDSSETRPLKRSAMADVTVSDISQMLLSLVEAELDCAAA